jgi:replication factor A1
VKLSTKNQIDANEFFNAFVHAWENGEAVCRGLTIQSRIKKKDRCVFLITKGRMVVAQFPILEKILRDPNPLDRFGYLRESVNHVFEMKDRKVSKTGHVRIKDLEVGMKGVSLKARVVEISRPKLVLTRLNEYVLLATATLSDRNSTIKVPLWNQRIQSVSVDDKVQIDNARVTMFRGEKQLRIGRNGKLKVIKSSSSHVAADAIECIAR